MKSFAANRAAARRALLLCVSLLLIASSVSADDSLVEPDDMPEPLNQVRIDQKLGDDLPLDIVMRDETGQAVRLRDVIQEKPVILAFVYYECPMLCSLIMNGLSKSLSVLQFNVGQEFDVVAISIDHGETSEMAAQAKRDAIDRYGRPQTADGWHFLTADEATVERLTQAAGFGFEYIPATDEYAHASSIMVVTPEGRLAQYFYGIEYSPKDLRLALVEASSNRIGNVVDQILLYCFRYDPQIGKYTVLAMRIVRLAGAVFAIGLIVFLWLSWRREKIANAQAPTLGAA